MGKCSCSHFSGRHAAPEETIIDFRVNLKWIPQNLCVRNYPLPITVYNGPKLYQFEISSDEIQTDLLDALKTADTSEYNNIRKMYTTSLYVTYAIVGMTVCK